MLPPARLLLALAALAGTANAASYLFWMPFISRSMKITVMPVAQELVDRGHEVTIVFPHASKKATPGIREVIVESEFDNIVKEISRANLIDSSAPSVPPILDMVNTAIDTNDNALSHPEIKKLLDDENTRFDVVTVSSFLANDAGYYLAHRFNASLCHYFTGQSSMPAINLAMGQPHNPAYMPLVIFKIFPPLKFFERVANTVATWVFQYVIRDGIIHSKTNALLDKHFPGVERPSLLDIERNASLGINFGHPLLMDGMRPVSPNYIHVGMINCREAQPLSEDLEKFMRTGDKDGVIFMSMGSVLHASLMSDDRRQMFLNVFGRLKQKVLWKWETETMEGKPDNLKLSKWLPQQDILAHKNVKLFITHGGQSSMQETLCHKKPTVSLPVEGDQHGNSEEMVRIGMGKAIAFKDLTEEKLYDAITEVLNNPDYTRRVQEMGDLLLDQETKPLDRAIWWLEHIARHPGQHYRSPVHDLAWHQYFLLDVLAFLALVAGFLVFVVAKTCQCLFANKFSSKAVMNGKKIN